MPTFMVSRNNGYRTRRKGNATIPILEIDKFLIANTGENPVRALLPGLHLEPGWARMMVSRNKEHL